MGARPRRVWSGYFLATKFMKAISFWCKRYQIKSAMMYVFHIFKIFRCMMNHIIFMYVFLIFASIMMKWSYIIVSKLFCMTQRYQHSWKPHEQVFYCRTTRGKPPWKCVHDSLRIWVFLSGRLYSAQGTQQKSMYPGRLTWNLRIDPWKRKIIFQINIFRFYVNLPGCICIHSNHMFKTASWVGVPRFPPLRSPKRPLECFGRLVPPGVRQCLWRKETEREIPKVVGGCWHYGCWTPKNRGVQYPPKWMVYNENQGLNPYFLLGWFWGVPKPLFFGNIH